MSDTRENILLAALRLFAEDGYEAVSVSRIAGALGMTKGALYKHYRNKRDIFDSILARMEELDRAHAAQFDLPEGTPGEMADAYRNASVDKIIGFSRAMFRYWTEEEFPRCFRRMLTLEQYRNAEMGALYQQYLAAGPLQYVTDLFAGLGLPDPRGLAAAFYGPMHLLYSCYDGASEKGEALALLDGHFEKMRAALGGKTDG